MAMEQHRHDISDRAWEKIRLTALVKRGRKEGMSVIPGNLSTEYSGFCAPERPGGIGRKRRETGRMYTAGSADGVTRGSGKGSWRPRWMTQTLSG